MSNEPPAPSQISGQLKSAQGMAESAVGAVLPTSMGGDVWAQSGEEHQREGQEEVSAAKSAAKAEATVDAGKAKVQSVFGYMTGDQKMQNEGNLDNESAQWRYKQANSDAPLAVPVPSLEGVKGKVESVAGMVTGDQKKQQEGNLRAEKAAWKDGV